MHIPAILQAEPLTPPTLAMPEEYRTNNPVESYRAYYNNDKRHLHKWANRETPFWITRRTQMDNDKELLEALLASKVLISEDTEYAIQLQGDDVKVLKCPNEMCIGLNLSDTQDRLLDITQMYWKIKQETILINGIEVPTPEKEIPMVGTKYYIPSFHHLLSDTVQFFTWAGNEADGLRLSNGLIHLTKENTTAHAKALLSFTSTEKEDV